MRTALALWMALIVVTATAWEIRDVHGIVHNTSNNNVIVILGTTNCPPMDNMLRYQLSGLKVDYPDILAMVVFPCTNQAPEAVKAWQVRSGISNFCPVEIDARIPHPLLSMWQSMGYPQYCGVMYGKSGECVTNWNFWRSRYSVEVPLTRQLNDLTIHRGLSGPVPSFRQTKIDWRIKTNRSEAMTTFKLVYP